MTETKSHTGVAPDPSGKQTLSGIVVRFGNDELQAELEKFLEIYERTHGKIDLTKRYTSTLSAEQQEWLRINHPKRYFDGLPEFFKAFLAAKMKAAHRSGVLDDMPDDYVALFISGQMKPGSFGQGL